MSQWQTLSLKQHGHLLWSDPKTLLCLPQSHAHMWTCTSIHKHAHGICTFIHTNSLTCPAIKGSFNFIKHPQSKICQRGALPGCNKHARVSYAHRQTIVRLYLGPKASKSSLLIVLFSVGNLRALDLYILPWFLSWEIHSFLCKRDKPSWNF